MSRDYLLYLEDMQEACRKLLRYTKGLTFDQFARVEIICDAVIDNLLIFMRFIRRRDSFIYSII
jgi:uncharacterized protein with HEPN domain